MAFDILDLRTLRILGPFATAREANEAVQKHNLEAYTLWEDGHYRGYKGPSNVWSDIVVDIVVRDSTEEC